MGCFTVQDRSTPSRRAVIIGNTRFEHFENRPLVDEVVRIKRQKMENAGIRLQGEQTWR